MKNLKKILAGLGLASVAAFADGNYTSAVTEAIDAVSVNQILGNVEHILVLVASAGFVLYGVRKFIKTINRS